MSLGCSSEPSCLQGIFYAFEIEVRDAVADVALPVTPRGITRDGEFQDSLRGEGNFLRGPEGRAGTYQIHIEADGYQPWDTTGVRVTRGDCNVHTVYFTAELSPGP
jgi:hypothetical protein